MPRAGVFFICFWLAENKICRGVPETSLAGGVGRQPFERKTGDGLTAASEWDKTVFEEVFG